MTDHTSTSTAPRPAAAADPQPTDEKIDAFCHILPRTCADQLFALDHVPALANLRRRVMDIPALVDLDVRFRQMDEFPGYRQLINLAAPPPEDFGTPRSAVQYVRMANDALADLTARHPDRFAGFSAAVALTDVDAAVAELDRAVGELGAVGVQIYTHVRGHPLDEHRFAPFWARAAELDVLVQVHPCRNATWPDYPAEQRSRYEIWWTLGWEYDLSAFMARIVFGGILEHHPSLKLLIHHGGSMIPHFSGRVGPGWDQLGSRTPPEQQADIEGPPLSKRPLDYFRMFYADTALFGAPHALRCALDFFGPERVLFASDSPYDPEKGPGYIRSSIADVHRMDLAPHERTAVFAGNLRRLTTGRLLV
ncbi:amidohydrolase family protein [Streptomyces flavofungini]|uniref:Amidohydrolase n=1 Tax=Streptomyces flavofungini TaxID=68200 RepID=A0ABS0XJW1_9ACTN|nr:amidohydrolase family protein [Streptomyces flavofungini]MBJ3813199.1 amidohydrolase [Streptomyces flavofungini]GHC90196.1 4-oxalomesaconate hydratase [Streptomyces flavofungini]